MSRGDGRRIDGRKVIVDRELGRTRKDWLPRRLGGGKGDSRRDRNDEDVIRKLKFELDQEERSARRLERERSVLKVEVPDDEPMLEKIERPEKGDKQERPESEKDSVERKKIDRSRSRSREHRPDEYRHSRK